MKPRIPVPQKPNKREIPKTVYNRKKAIPFSEFLDWLGDEVRPKPMSEEEYHKQCP